MIEIQQEFQEVKTAYFNRELSWLAFNRRVLEQAFESDYPALERMRFLGFVSSNLDEFFEIRVAGLIQQVDSGVIDKGLDGLGPKEQLRHIHSITSSLVNDTYRCWHQSILPTLRTENIVFKTKAQLTTRELHWCEKYFDDQVYPVLTPLAIDPAHPFPQIGNKTLNILVWLENPVKEDMTYRIAVVPVPRILPRVVRIPGGLDMPATYIFLSDILRQFSPKLFPGYKIKSAEAFRITRNSDLYIDEEEVENLLKTIEEELHKLRRGAAVRLEIEDTVNEGLLESLLESINLSKEFVFRINGPLNLMRLLPVYDLIDRPELKFKPHIPFIPPALHQAESIFDVIAKEDYLLHHPYDSFSPVIEFVEQAAKDPKVLAIKLTLYRTSSDSQIVKALIEAARNGKQVAALIELKARFDEAQNIQWAKQLEEAGVHVVYGIVGLKTHCKCILVVRREGDILKRYAHLGTGNYHPKTAKLYTDLSIFTVRPDITNEVAGVFNTLTGFALSPNYKKLLVAPYNLHQTMQKFIKKEIANAKKGKPARIIVKTNSLVDKETIDNLYLASQAGVKIDLIIRGICGLVPGVPGMSDNITVRSILGRYLEHSRIFYFENAGRKAHIYAGSADWMPRNFYRRIEVVTPVEGIKLRKRVRHILDIHLKDTAHAKFLQPNGAYYPAPKQKEEELFCSQENLLKESAVKRRKATYLD